MSLEDDEIKLTAAEESLLYSARHGELKVVQGLLNAKKEGTLSMNLNCKGLSKSNNGWTPLHLATYFGHLPVVEALLEAGADVDVVNHSGDTPLHKACFIGNMQLVVTLLNNRADVNIMNGEGKTAMDVSKTEDIRRLVEAALMAEQHVREIRLLTAVKEGRMEEVQKILSAPDAPNINCVDLQGNTCLHCAAYRGHQRLAILLLQNGINTYQPNYNGKLAIDLAKDEEMREILKVRPVQRLQTTAARFEGPLLKKSRFLGWRPVWAVLRRGVLLYFGSRAEAAKEGGKWRARKYLDDAAVSAPDHQPALLLLEFSDGDAHRLAVPQQDNKDLAACRQSWVTAFNEHIAFSGHYLKAGTTSAAKEATEDLEDEGKPLGSMQDALTSATNHLALLDTQLRECAAIVAALDKCANVGNSLHHSAYMRFQHAAGTGQEALASLRHCAALVAQTQDHTTARLNREIERNRVLEEALAALARTHHELEISIAQEMRKKGSTNNFYDVCEGKIGSDESDEDDTLVTAGIASPLLGPISPWASLPELPLNDCDGEKTPTNEDHENLQYGDVIPLGARSLASPQSLCSDASLHTALSAASSRGTLVSYGGHVYRNARPYAKTKLSSQWSL